MESPYIALLRRAQEEYAAAGVQLTYGLAQYGLDNVDCPICKNMGYVLVTVDDEVRSRECECMKKRRSIRSIKNSGIEDMLGRYTFENYETPDAHRKAVKDMAQRFVESDTGWFYISGRSGSGKSHICTAICSALIEKNKEVKYIVWRDESAALKSSIMDFDAYQSRVQKFKDVPVLYIDDFWKGDVTEADIKLTFELLNARYIDSKKRTVLSSERSLKDIISIDEAIGGRIYERCRGFHIKAPDENWRLRK